MTTAQAARNADATTMRVKRVKCVSASIMPILGSLLLSACVVGPDYHRAEVTVPANYKEPAPSAAADGWKSSQPQNAASDAQWWSIYADPVLDGLEQQVEVSNQSLQVSEAAFRQSDAVLRQARAAFFPALTLNAGATRSRSSTSGGQHQLSSQFDLGVDANWAPDLWGRIHRTVESNAASAQASAADLASARLSIQAQLASDYFELRIADELKRLLDETVIAYKRSLTITQNRYAVGVAAKSDVVTAQTQVQNTLAQSINVGVQRAKLEHAIAVLIGKAPSELSIDAIPLTNTLPEIPAGLPSTLLERRPDIASAERLMAASNAQIGVAISAYFPDLSLSGSAGYASSTISQLLNAPMRVWSVGPQLAATLFDAGVHSAQVAAARAAYDASVANYRQTVLSSFQQVEDELSTQAVLKQQAEVQQQAIALAKEAEQLALNEYKAGIVDFTSVVQAQAIALSTEQSGLTIQQDQFVASVTLIEALGGGWDSSKLPQSRQLARGF
ncbi:MAG: transporter [Nevskia sp.]|nr:transporter [Nevskia sp.]